MSGRHTRRFCDELGFAPDRFQTDAFAALDLEESVLVAAPTGSGKTAVAGYALAQALDRDLRGFYTAPIKALSNQKFADLRGEHGPERVGLLTGDNAINGDASIVVMTTEVLRNMIYAGRELDDLDVVVLDEVHYLQDAYRGPVWEEVIVGLPRHVRLVALSATVSNAEEIGEWLRTVRGPTRVVVEERRPVTLDHAYLVGDRKGDRLHLVPTLVDGRANEHATRFDVVGAKPAGRRAVRDGKRPAGGPRGRRYFTPDRVDVVETLQDEDLLPAIVFVFSRAGCDQAVRTWMADGNQLTTAEERRRIREIVAAHTSTLEAADLDALGYRRWKRGLEAGVAAHHAGHVPPFKEAVEACFVEGLVKVVFATETLALGINMPARAVVIESLRKFNGAARVPLTPGEYSQLTGRAGRRGIDEQGTAVVLWSPFVPFGEVAALAASRSFVLRSAFRPTYNMAANLVRRYTPDRAHEVLSQSLAQFQADRAVVVNERRRSQVRAELADAQRDATCERGDVAELAAALSEADGADHTRLGDVADAVAALEPGDVVAFGSSDRLAVLSVAFRAKGRVKMRVVDGEGEAHTLFSADLDQPPVRLAHIDLPEPYAPNSRAFLDDVRRRLVRVRPAKGRRRPGPPAIDHPVASCPRVSEHLSAQRRAARLARQLADLDRRAEQRSSTLVNQFETVLEVLGGRDFVQRGSQWGLTSKGELLAGVYHECDLLVAECLASGTFDGLNAAELAAAVSSLVYEHRSRDPAPEPEFPSAEVRRAVTSVERTWRALAREERECGLHETRQPDPGFVELAHDWCAGASLADVLDAPLSQTGGDFVRTVRQLADLVRQLGELAPDPRTARAARQAAALLVRDVVSASGSLDDRT